MQSFIKVARSLLKVKTYIGSTRFNGNLSFEIESMGTGVRAGEIYGVNPLAMDSCKVCLAVIGPNDNTPPWMQVWIDLHDGYDEWNCGRGALCNSDKTELLTGKLCGKYCCEDIPPTDMLQ